jgi:hypothetical protein
MAVTDPSGILLKRQGMETFLANRDAQQRADYGPGGNAIDQAVHMTGPMPDPQWQAFFQALKNQGVTKMTGGRTATAPGTSGATDRTRLLPGDQVRNAETNQFRGESVQPDYFSGGDTFMGRGVTPYGGDDPEYAKYAGRVQITPPETALGRSIAALRNRALPKPEGHDTFIRRLYAGDPDNLAAGLALSKGSTP